MCSFTTLCLQEVMRTFHEDVRCVRPELYASYPSLVHMNVVRSQVEGSSAPTQLLNCISNVLKVKGSKGVHSVVRSSHIGTAAFYLGLGFTDITENENCPDDVLIFAKAL